jgi:ATP-dependent Zn protease
MSDKTIEITGKSRRLLIVWAVIFLGIILLMCFREYGKPANEQITQYRFEELLSAGQIVQGTINYDPQNSALNEIVGRYSRINNGEKTEVPFRATVRLSRGLEERLLNLPQFEPRQPNNLLMSIAVAILPFVVIALLIYFFFIRQIKKAAKMSPSFADLQTRTAAQQDRLDKIMDKWEEQARRMDAVIGKMERGGDQPKQ